jgi:predicted RND superfamily exporter protein
MMNKFSQHVIKHPWQAIGFTVVVTLLLGYQMKNLVMDPDISGSIPDTLPAKQMYDRLDDLFPAKDFVFIGISGEDVFSPAHLQTVWDLTVTLEDLADVSDVLSPTNVQLIIGTEEGMEVRDILDAPPTTSQEVARYKTDLMNNDIALGNIVSEDMSMLAIMLMLKPGIDDMEFTGELVEMMETRDADTDLDYILAGGGVTDYYISLAMQRDMGVFFMGGLALIFVLLLVVFRTVRGVLVPLAVVILSVIWTLGLMGLTRVTMSHATEAMPILIMSIAVADSIHILSHYYIKSRKEKDRKRLTAAVMADMTAPVVMTSLTTMAGFLSLAISILGEQIKLGVFTAAGVFFAMVLSITLVPAILSLLPIPKRLLKRETVSVDARLMTWWGTYLVRSRKIFYPLTGLLVVICGIGIARISHDYSQVENFPLEHPIRVAYERINEHFAGTNTFDIMVEGDSADAIKDPRILKDLDELKARVLTHDHVGDALSLADMVKRMNKVLNGDDPAFHVIPDERVAVQYTDWEQQGDQWVEVERIDTVAGREQVAQFLTLYEMSGKPEDLANLVDYEYRNARMTVFLNTDDMGTLRSVNDDLEEFISGRFPGTRTAVTGMASLLLILDDLIVSGQIRSMLIALFFIWLITSLMFRSPVIGLFNIETMMISSIIIGVGVDYAIHFIYAYRRRLAWGDDYDQAIPEAMGTSGLAIAYNSLIVAAGFAVIMLSQFVSIRHMGALISLTMLTTAFGALTLLPLVFVNLKPRSLLPKNTSTGV